jgi:TRAP-type C4-dicarboxylate transport system permease small subunit
MHGIMQSSSLSPPLSISHWILFLEAVYCFVIVGLAYGAGEGFSAALDIFIRVLSFREDP